MGHSMPTHSLFSRPISDFDEIWQTDWPFRETNTHQVSAHYHHYWWSYSTSKISEIYQNFRLWDTKYTLTRKVTNWFFKNMVPLERGDNFLSNDMLLDDLLRHLTFQGHFLRPWPLTYIFRNTYPSIFLNFGEEVLSDVGKGHAKFGFGELGISY